TGEDAVPGGGGAPTRALLARSPGLACQQLAELCRTQAARPGSPAHGLGPARNSPAYPSVSQIPESERNVSSAMRILITGASGFIGTNLLEACRRAGCDVRN